MKKKTKTMALFLVLSMMALSCQKESIEPIASTNVGSEMNTLYRVCYAIDGVTHQITLNSEEAYSDFIYQMLALAERGYEVAFFDEYRVSQNLAAKEIVTYDTPDKDDAYAWAHQMSLNGYSVQIKYDNVTNTFHCTAIK